MNTALELQLLNDYQHDFPLIPEPFAAIAECLGIAQSEVLQMLKRLQQQGTVSRVGAVFRPRSIGVSTLAALAVAEDKLDEVAQMVNSYPEVNHNYQREHHYNLWFVVAAPDEVTLQRVLKEIEERSDCKVLFLPLVEEYHIDLGFDMTGCKRKNVDFIESHTGSPRQPYLLNEQESRLIAAIQSGLPIVERPFSAVGAALGLSETDVIEGVQNLIRLGVIKRVGVVVRHHELGYRANAMVVWDIPDEEISQLGSCLGKLEFVTLCYRRPRRLPAWRYNLFCMIHGHDREEVLALVEKMRQGCGLQHIACEVLFSTRRFKQCGARYARAAA
jgi:DNA-binding Lrp family transcriptional regulator